MEKKSNGYRVYTEGPPNCGGNQTKPRKWKEKTEMTTHFEFGDSKTTIKTRWRDTEIDENLAKKSRPNRNHTPRIQLKNNFKQSVIVRIFTFGSLQTRKSLRFVIWFARLLYIPEHTSVCITPSARYTCVLLFHTLQGCVTLRCVVSE